MVAKLNNQLSRYLNKHRVRYARSGLIAMAIMLLFFTDSAQAQHFLNSGTYKATSTGLFRVKGSATGLPDTVGGTFEFFGPTQTVQATNYTKLLLTGAWSTKSSQGGNVKILQTAKVDTNVLFQINTADTMKLNRINGQLIEFGSVLGKTFKSVDFIPDLDSSDFGGIGLSISWKGTNPGYTSVTRTSGTSISVNGKSSIQRFFDIKATTDSLLNANLTFTFSAVDLQGQNPASLDLWRSPDGGLSWRRQRVSHTGMTLTRTSIPTFGSNGRWTAADTNNLLGIAQYEWEADSLKRIAGNNQFGRIRKMLDTAFVARVVDAFNQPIHNQLVQFAIIDTPTSAKGQSLTAAAAASDSLGQVRTQLTFGNIKGNYRVRAFVPGVPSAIDTFIATAKSSISSLIAHYPVYKDSVKSTITPITFTAKDEDSLLVAQVPLAIKIIAPDTNYRMNKDTFVTDTAGKVTASMIFGKKSGKVIVHAYSTDDTTVGTTFDLTAVPGCAAKINNSLVGGVAKDTVMRVKQFAVNLYDCELNGRKGDTVLISWADSTKSKKDSLFTTFVIIDSLGNPTTPVLARLGEKVGNYTLKATAKNNPWLSSSINLTATNDVPAKTVAFPTLFTDTIGAVVRQLAIILRDRYDNSVPFTPVTYTVTVRPDTTAGGKVDSAVVHTDSIGRANNTFTIGSKIGTYQVNAKVNGIQSTFSITATPGVPQKLFTTQGLYQSKEILSPLSPFVVKLTDRASNPIQNDTIFFTVIDTPSSTNGVALSRNLAVTDANGFASTQLTLGDKVGTYTVQATSKNINSVFSAKATHGAAKSLAYKVGRGQQQPILTSLDTFVVRLKDIGGNPVPGIPVTFAVDSTPNSTAWGYKLSKDTVWTDSFGEAKTILTLGSKVGLYGVVARTSVLPSDSVVRFYASATVGAAKTLAQHSGNNQVGQLGDHLKPFVVQVKDAGDNFVPNTGVIFTMNGQPDTLTRNDSLLANGFIRRDSMVVATDSSGMASASLILGNRPGRYTVKASAIGLSDTMFIANAIMLYADVNSDDYRNIGDLTAIIDHILGRKLLTGYAFNKADMYPIHKDGTVGDEKVDIRDAQVCLDSLLKNGWNPTFDWLQTTASSLAKIGEGSVPLNSGSTFLTSTTDSCYVQTTFIGSRFTLKNIVPIKGLQAVIYMKTVATLDTTDIIFPRAKMMKANVKSIGREVSVILWNANNTPIDTGDSPLFRLPIQLTNNNVDSIQVLTSSGDNNLVALMNMKQEDIRNSIPRDWMLYQNYPNPFNPSTTIEFDVPEVAGTMPHVAIQIFNLLGQKVRVLEPGIHDAQRYKVKWDGTSDHGTRVASGVYFYRLLAGEYASTKKMVMLK